MDNCSLNKRVTVLEIKLVKLRELLEPADSASESEPCLEYDPRITTETWDQAEAKWQHIVAKRAGAPAPCSFCSLFGCYGCPLWTAEGCCGDAWYIWLGKQSVENATSVLAFIQRERRKWEAWRAKQTKAPGPSPEPCPKCGEPLLADRTRRLALAYWSCGSQKDDRGRFHQNMKCELRQLRAACDANGRMNGGWPVMVNTTVSFWSDVERAICSSLIYTINIDGTVSLEGGWRDYKPSELWHTREEAEAALAEGGAS